MQNGLLTRRGGMYDVVAFDRGTGYGPQAHLAVHHLYAVTPEAATALVAVLAGWRTVARSLRWPSPLGARSRRCCR